MTGDVAETEGGGGDLTKEYRGLYLVTCFICGLDVILWIVILFSGAPAYHDVIAIPIIIATQNLLVFGTLDVADATPAFRVIELFWSTCGFCTFCHILLHPQDDHGPG